MESEQEYPVIQAEVSEFNHINGENMPGLSATHLQLSSED